MSRYYSPKVAQAAESRNRLSLLGLPREIRNMIYRRALVSGREIVVDATVDSALPEPGRKLLNRKSLDYQANRKVSIVLSACKQVRTETMLIYYLENYFIFMLVAYDPAPLLKWHEKELALIPGRHFDMIYYPGAPNWTNLLRRLELYHSMELAVKYYWPQHLLCRCAFCYTDTIILALFDTVERLGDSPWARVKSVLETYQKTLVILDSRWR